GLAPTSGASPLSRGSCARSIAATTSEPDAHFRSDLLVNRILKRAAFAGALLAPIAALDAQRMTPAPANDTRPAIPFKACRYGVRRSIRRPSTRSSGARLVRSVVAA